MRCFLAVIPPADVIAGIERFLEPRRTASQRSPWRWTRPGSYHVTLAFMADYPDQRTEELIQGLDAWAQRRAPLTMTVAGAGAFRSPERAKVLYLGVPGEAAARLGEWSQQLRALVTHHGGSPDGAGFTPHLTVARAASSRPSTPTSQRRSPSPRWPSWSRTWGSVVTRCCTAHRCPGSESLGFRVQRTGGIPRHADNVHMYMYECTLLV